MKLTCKEPGCGTVIQTAIEDTATAHKLMDEHVASQHGTVEEMHRKTLEACLKAFSAHAMGAKLSLVDAVTLHNQVADLLGKQHLVLD